MLTLMVVGARYYLDKFFFFVIVSRVFVLKAETTLPLDRFSLSIISYPFLENRHLKFCRHAPSLDDNWDSAVPIDNDQVVGETRCVHLCPPMSTHVHPPKNFKKLKPFKILVHNAPM